ncbi:acyltransferase [Legionella dresdenensis]|uniref:Acyltransferase n=1 Tax=Legionella dresdenensis TaxID=450200 RepID=A0ABV8CBU7_9GAMM
MSNQKKSGGEIKAALALLLLIVSTVIFFIPVLCLGLLKLIPVTRWRVGLTRAIDNVVEYWAEVNNIAIRKTQKVSWQVNGLEHLKPNDWHLIIANHQSWLDIVVLQYIFNGKIPMLKFFIKNSLKWVPLLGFAWWAMGCPFMKRYSREYLRKNPSRRGKDLEATRKAMALFKYSPASITNFVEGTRFTASKKELQQSPYRYLLKPRAGGISFVIGALNNSINRLIDVSIVYSEENHSLWDFLCHRIDVIAVDIREVAIPAEFSNPDLVNDEETQLQFRLWLNNLWLEKDNIIHELKKTCALAANKQSIDNTVDTMRQNEQCLPEN